jgi:hypothetical protein
MKNLEEITKRLEKVEQRNKRVELDKAWETSWTRKVLLIVFTYFAIGLYMMAIGVPHWWINAIVPAVGFLLSTLSLQYFRKFWEQYIYKK